MKLKNTPPKIPYVVGEKCMIPLCPMTLVYSLGGGQYICWLHVIAHFPELLGNLEV